MMFKDESAVIIALLTPSDFSMIRRVPTMEGFPGMERDSTGGRSALDSQESAYITTRKLRPRSQAFVYETSLNDIEIPFESQA